MSDLGLRLERLGLSQYLEAFVSEGFDTWETVLDITESDLYVQPCYEEYKTDSEQELTQGQAWSSKGTHLPCFASQQFSPTSHL
jgi:hypothetical protein